MRVWIAQCLCPQRHCIVALSHECETRAQAERLADLLRAAIAETCGEGKDFNPWCSICGAKQETWHIEIGRTPYRSMAEAMPHLRRTEQENLATNALLGVHRGTGRAC